MFGALKSGRFRSLASLSYTCSECCWRTSTEKDTCGIARFPCGSMAFLFCIHFGFMWPGLPPFFVLPGVIIWLCLDSLSSYGRRAFAVAGPTVWNSLSDDLRGPTLSTDSFRRLPKTRLFSEYYYIQCIRGIALHVL